MPRGRPKATPRQRRPKGSGSIVARADGRFEVRFPKPGGGSLSRYARSRPDAERVLADLIVNGVPQPDPTPRLSVADYLDRWLRTVVAPNHPDGTYLNYRDHVVWRITPYLGRIALADLTGQDIQRMMAELVQQGYAPSTIRVCRNVLASALAVAAEDWRLIPFNPTPRRGLPKRRVVEPEALTPARARQILAATAGSEAWGPTALALCYGLRESEALGLRRVDLTEAAVRIEGQLDRRTRRHVPPKSIWSRRELPIVPLATTAIAVQSVRGPWLFSRPDGGPLPQRDLIRVYDAALRAAEIAGPGSLKDQQVHFHSLRHGCVSLLMGLGVDERTRQAIVGHAPQGTHGHYSHTTPAAVQSACERLSALLTGDDGMAV